MWGAQGEICFLHLPGATPPLEAAGTGRINGAAPGSAARTEGAAPSTNLSARACFGVQRSLSGSWKHAGSLGARREHRSSGKEGAVRGFIYRWGSDRKPAGIPGCWQRPGTDPPAVTTRCSGTAGTKNVMAERVRTWTEHTQRWEHEQERKASP